MGELSLPWIPIDPLIASHPKSLRFAALAGVSGELEPWLYVLRILMYAGARAPDGRLLFAAPELAGIARWTRSPAKLLRALITSTWLRRIPGGYEIVGWNDHGGIVLNRRKEWRRRQRQWRKNGRTKRHENVMRDVTLMSRDVTVSHAVDRDRDRDRDPDRDLDPIRQEHQLPLVAGTPRQVGFAATAAGPEGAKAGVEAAFAYWQSRLEHPTAKLTQDRRQKLLARFREGFTLAQIKQAIDGCAASAFYRGENERGTVYDDLTLICRSGSKVEQFIELARTNHGGWRRRDPRVGSMVNPAPPEAFIPGDASKEAFAPDDKEKSR